MDTRLTVAVVIPTYNCAPYIEEALRSIEAQTWVPERVVVVDDGSTDGTTQVVERFATRSPLPLMVLRQPNRGPAAARNAGIAHCEEDLIAFLDGDDTFYPPLLERAARALAQHPELVLCFMDRDVVDSHGNFMRHDLDHPRFRSIGCERRAEGVSILTESPFMALVAGTVIPMASVVRRRAIEAINGFNEEMRLAEDKLFFMQLSRLGSFGFLDEPLGMWRRHESNTSGPRNAFETMYYADLVLARIEGGLIPLKLTEQELQAIGAQRKENARIVLYAASNEARPEFWRVAWDMIRERRAPYPGLPRACLRYAWRRIRRRRGNAATPL